MILCRFFLISSVECHLAVIASDKDCSIYFRYVLCSSSLALIACNNEMDYQNKSRTDQMMENNKLSNIKSGSLGIT